MESWPFIFGAEHHSGWVPSGAAPPRPTAAVPVTLTLEIHAENDGYFLRWESSDGSKRGDTWHQSVADAKHQAKAQFGIPESKWRQEH